MKVLKALRSHPKNIIIAVLVIINLLEISLYLYGSMQKQEKRPLGIEGNDNINSIITRLESVVEFPVYEKPSRIANISDISKLSGRSFFANAKNGDIVFIYENNKMAVLFRPSSGKIISIGPLGNTGTLPVPTINITPTGQLFATESAR